MRDFGVRMKLNPVRSLLEGKRVILIDDSIIRGTTSRKIVRMVRAAGATEVHLRISCPPTISPCFYGVDTPSKKDLIAANKSIAEICEFIEADSLAYLSLEGLLHSCTDWGRESEYLLYGLLYRGLSDAVGGCVGDSAGDGDRSNKDMSCRTGPLRVGRPLRGGCTGLGGTMLHGPPVGRGMMFRPAGGPMLLASPRQVKKACERPPSAQEARPAGHCCSGERDRIVK